MKRSLLAAGAMLLAVAGAAHAESDRLVTVVTSAEPQTQLMAMVLTMQAVQQGTDVHMLLCGPGEIWACARRRRQRRRPSRRVT